MLMMTNNEEFNRNQATQQFNSYQPGPRPLWSEFPENPTFHENQNSPGNVLTLRADSLSWLSLLISLSRLARSPLQLFWHTSALAWTMRSLMLFQLGALFCHHWRGDTTCINADHYSHAHTWNSMLTHMHSSAGWSWRMYKHRTSDGTSNSRHRCSCKKRCTQNFLEVCI